MLPAQICEAVLHCVLCVRGKQVLAGELVEYKAAQAEDVLGFCIDGQPAAPEHSTTNPSRISGAAKVGVMPKCTGRSLNGPAAQHCSMTNVFCVVAALKLYTQPARPCATAGHAQDSADRMQHDVCIHHSIQRFS